MNPIERVFRETLMLSNLIEEKGAVTAQHIQRWNKLKRIIKRYLILESRSLTLKHYQFEKNIKPTVKEIVNNLRYFSDRWTRSRMYQMDILFNNLKDQNENSSNS